jgi:mRNA interferase MazF
MAGGPELNRGEVWWARLPPPANTRPVVLVTRAHAIARRRFVTVVPVTTRVRQIPSEIHLGEAEGLARESIANCDDLQTIPKQVLLQRAGALGVAKIGELDEALRYTLGLE